MGEQKQSATRRRRELWAFVVRLLAVLAAVTGIVLLVKPATEPEQQLERVLDAESRALNQGNWRSFAALQDPEDPVFYRYQEAAFRSAAMARRRGESVTEPTRYVVVAERQGEKAWALVLEDPDDDPASGPATIAFFRRAHGQWLHTGPDPGRWGAMQESDTGWITWRYREADAGQVARLATFAEAFAQQFGHDVAMEAEAGSLVVRFCYSLDCGKGATRPGGEIEVPAPWLHGLDQESMEVLLATQIASDLAFRASAYGAQSPTIAPIVLYGISRWEVAQVIGQAATDDELPALREALAAGVLPSLDDLDRHFVYEDVELLRDQAYALIEYIVDQSGREILPALVQAAAHQPDTAGMLREVLGRDQDLASFEEGWQRFVRERYGEGSRLPDRPVAHLGQADEARTVGRDQAHLDRAGEVRLLEQGFGTARWSPQDALRQDQDRPGTSHQQVHHAAGSALR